MSKGTTGGQVRRAARAAPIVLCFVLCLALCGCASTSTEFLLLADPGKYQYHNCQQLADARAKTLVHQKNLRELIEKAEKGTGGMVMGALAYRSDYLAVDQDLQVIDATAREKNCPQAPTAAPATRGSDSAIH